MIPSLLHSHSVSWARLTHMPTMILLTLVIGASWEQIPNYLVGTDVTGFRPFDSGFPLGNPTTLALFLGLELQHVDLSIIRLSQLISRLNSLTTVEIKIHESVWSHELAAQLVPLPANVKNVTLSVSDFRIRESELFRIQFNANARPFTASLTASFFGIRLFMEGYLSDLTFMLALPRQLAKLTFTGSCTVRIQVNRQRILALEIHGGGVQSILGALVHADKKSQYTINSLRISIPMLHHRDEFNNFLASLHTQTPRLRILIIQIDALHPEETAQWTNGIRNLVHIRELTRVDIVHPLPLPLLDGDVGRLLISWRNAEYISLNPKPSHSHSGVLTPGQLYLTRNALKGVAAHAPMSLTHLGLYLDAERISVFGSGNVRAQVGIRKVELGVAKVGSVQRTREVVAMARRLFPNAEVVLV